MTNKETAKYFYEYIATNNLLDRLQDYIAESCVIRVGEDELPSGVEGMREHFLAVRTTYPDLKMNIIRQYADGDTVISEFIMEGAHLGGWPGTKPTGKKLRIYGVDIDKFYGGKIVEHCGAVNTFEALFGAGIIKPAQ